MHSGDVRRDVIKYGLGSLPMLLMHTPRNLRTLWHYINVFDILTYLLTYNDLDV